MLLSFEELSKYSVNSGFLGGRHHTPIKIGFDLGKKMSIKIFSMLQKTLSLWL